MSDDLVQRLREITGFRDCREAADRIEAQEREIARLTAGPTTRSALMAQDAEIFRLRADNARLRNVLRATCEHVDGCCGCLLYAPDELTAQIDAAITAEDKP